MTYPNTPSLSFYNLDQYSAGIGNSVGGGGGGGGGYAAVGSYTLITNIIIEEKGEKLLFGEHIYALQQTSTWFYTWAFC